MRKIPATMATQHPDNASTPYWGSSPFISTLEEVDECFRVFSDLDCDEYMWDWEGKFVDEAVVDRLFHRYADYFKKRQLGRDKFLTFRIPNIWEETGFRLARSYMTIITASHSAREHGFHVPPIFEVILPMTTSARQLLTILKKYLEAVKYGKAIFDERIGGEDQLELIPLIEGGVTLFHSRKILRDYVAGYQKLKKRRPSYLRPFIARSDPALDAGFVSAVLSARGAISEYYRFSEESGIPVYPIIGVGALPFRGGLSPAGLNRFLKTYAGVRTVTIQSAHRYDFPVAEVRRMIHHLKRELPRRDPALFGDAELREMTRFSNLFSSIYRPTITQLAPAINDIARFVPSHRERIPHTGHFGYSRRVGKNRTRMPRAIAFVASLASLGIPPTLIGTGRGLREIVKRHQEKALLSYLPTLPLDLELAGNYFNRENLKFLIRGDSAWMPVLEDVEFIEVFLGKRLGPEKPEHYIHRNLTSIIYHLWKGKKKEVTEEILHAGRIRRSLG